ncbi:MAG TPA: glycosyltransferase [Solirubrobacteraceae bacterium]|nr:glycosyltransferase [Solirubrobacteraceae bacterium]
MQREFDNNLLGRAVGLVMLAAIVWFVPWLVMHANVDKLWVTIPFLAATALVCVAAILSVVNRWQRAVPFRAPVRIGSEPRVAVIIPTMGEALYMLEATVRSVLDQDWPLDKLWVLVSDDGHDDDVRDMLLWLQTRYPSVKIHYHRPPKHGDPARPGEAKAGNLNSAMKLVPEDVLFIETRDADDLVGERRFLRETIGQLLERPRLAFAQTAKAGKVASHDPFDNQQPHFFQCAMLSRFAANSVFPCGSGVVWRRAALSSIGGFPTWNLVEDLQSGVEAMRRGWEGTYVPILGAYAQHSPEDLPNFVKQRGTWALDTVRMMLWAPKRGLTLRQRLQFYELGVFYLQGPATLVFLAAPIFGFLFHWYPVVTSTGGFILHFWPFAGALELYLVVIHRPMSFEQIWRARLVWAGLSFVYAKACLLALLGGRKRKPRYVVTRKENLLAWHWRQVAPHAVLLLGLLGSMAYSLIHRGGVLGSFDIGSAYWAVLYGMLMAGFIRLSWHGVNLSRGEVARRVGQRRRRRLRHAPYLLGQGGGMPSTGAAEVVTSPLVWSVRNPKGVLTPFPGEAIGQRSRESLRQLELRISEWSGIIDQPAAVSQLPREAGGIVSSFES